MKIDIVWGKGEGRTLLSAFDRALHQAGIHNFNLVPLSSVIPKHARVEEVGCYRAPVEVGSIRHVVIASWSSRKPRSVISAGLGWVQTKQGGLFLESKGEFSRQECEMEIRNGLEDMLEVRGWRGEIRTRVVSHRVEKIGSVTVVAVYRPE